MLRIKNINYIFFFTFSVFFLFSADLNAETGKYKMKGRVVKFGGDIGIDNVEVRVKYSKDGNVEIEPPPKTKDGGNYDFEVPIRQDKVWIEYIPEDTTIFEPAGRSAVKNSANPKDLDTIGLVMKNQACAIPSAARAAAWNSVEFLWAGGDMAEAVGFPQALKKEGCNSAFGAVREDKELLLRMEELKFNEWLN
jgi:hypothetical protein